MMTTLLLFSVLAVLVFGQLPFTFFQQDEWAIFSNYLYWQKAGLDWFQRLFVYEQDTHLIPLSNLFSYFQFKFFGLSFFPFGVVAIILHLVNSLLVYKFTLLLTKNRSASIISGLLFLVNSIPHQAITWSATTIGTAGSTLFVLLSLIFFLRYLDADKLKHFVVSLIFFLASLGFKETSVFLFFFYPVFWLIYTKTKKLIGLGLTKILLSLGIVGIGYVLIRLLVSSFWVGTAATAAELSQPTIVTYVFRILANPLKVITQSLVPVPIILKIAREIVRLGYPQFMQGGAPDPYLVETVASDMVTYSMAFVLLAIVAMKGFSRVLTLSFFFLIGSSLPLIIVPGKAGYISLLDGRHLYLPSIFVVIAFSIMLFKLRKLLMLGAVLAALFYHGIKIKRDIAFQVAVGGERQSILSDIITKYPKLPARVVFYVESDTAFYGLAPGDTIPPFQSGFGQTLLVWYNAHGENFPACFFEKKFLYVLTSQDYKECGGRGFGYWRKFDDLKASVKTNRLKPENIIAFSYSGGEHNLKDITQAVRQKL